MSITAGQIAQKLQQALNLASALDPKIALAAAGVNALTSLFGSTSELKTMMDQVMAETEATAPEVARAVSDSYTRQGDILVDSFHNHPGKVRNQP